MRHRVCKLEEVVSAVLYTCVVPGLAVHGHGTCQLQVLVNRVAMTPLCQ